MSHSRKRVHGSSGKKGSTKVEQEEEVPASQDPVGIITEESDDPIQEDQEEQDQQENKENIQPSSPAKKPRLELTESFDNKQVFQPLSSSFSITEVKEHPTPTTTTAMVHYKPQAQPMVAILPSGQRIEYKNNREGYAKAFKAHILVNIAKRGGVATPGEKIMLKEILDFLSDPVKYKLTYYAFFPPKAAQWADSSYQKDGQTVIKLVAKWDAIQPSFDGAQIKMPVQRAYFSELAPCGNWDPQGRDNRPKAINSAKNKCDFTYRESVTRPEYTEDMRDATRWTEELNESARHYLANDPSSPVVKKLQEQGLKPFSDNPDERQAYMAAFNYHYRGLWKDDKDGKYKYSYKASDFAFKKTGIKDSISLQTQTYVVPGNLRVIRDLYEFTLPDPIKAKGKDGKEMEVQPHLVHNDIPIFNTDGKVIYMHDRKEIKIYSDEKQTRLIPPKDRERTIVDGEWTMPTLVYCQTYKFPDVKNNTPWNIGLSRKLVSIQKHAPPDVQEHTERQWDETTADPTKLPRGLEPITDDMIQAELKKEQERLGAELDSAMLAYDMPASAGSSQNQQSN
jgi:hypothetical protein